MKHTSFIVTAFALLLFVGSAFVVLKHAPEYKVKEGFQIKFKSKDPTGEFTALKGTIKFDENDLATSKFELSMDVNSISTGNGMKNKKAQTEEWFNAAKHPQITYVSSRIEKKGDDYLVHGTLSIKGTSKEKSVPLKVQKSGNELIFTGQFIVNRIDYNVGKKSNVVPDEMNISYSIPVIKK